MADKVPLLGPEELRIALGSLGDLLTTRKQHYEIVVVGGTALALTGGTRPTSDVDVVALQYGHDIVKPETLPPSLAEAVRDVARVSELRPDWLNIGPKSLMDLGLPKDFERRLSTFVFGDLVVHVAGRQDQISFKLYAAVDQGPRSKHFADLLAIEPSPGELIQAAEWARTHDPSVGFRQELLRALRDLGVPDADV
jgi:hypothetical protein